MEFLLSTSPSMYPPREPAEKLLRICVSEEKIKGNASKVNDTFEFRNEKKPEAIYSTHQINRTMTPTSTSPPGLCP